MNSLYPDWETWHSSAGTTKICSGSTIVKEKIESHIPVLAKCQFIWLKKPKWYIAQGSIIIPEQPIWAVHNSFRDVALCIFRNHFTNINIGHPFRTGWARTPQSAVLWIYDQYVPLRQFKAFNHFESHRKDGITVHQNNLKGFDLSVQTEVLRTYLNFIHEVSNAIITTGIMKCLAIFDVVGNMHIAFQQ